MEKKGSDTVRPLLHNVSQVIIDVSREQTAAVPSTAVPATRRRYTA